MPDNTPQAAEMKPIRLNRDLVENIRAEKATQRTDPAFKEITAGLQAGIAELLRDPSRLTISCCIEGCCVSWCCIQIS